MLFGKPQNICLKTKGKINWNYVCLKTFVKQLSFQSTDLNISVKNYIQYELAIEEKGLKSMYTIHPLSLYGVIKGLHNCFIK